MSAREFDPCHLDVEAFAAREGVLEGAWPITDFERLAQSVQVVVGPSGEGDHVHWQAEGGRRGVAGGRQQVWLNLKASARVGLVCQRCLKTVEQQLVVQRRVQFVPGEEAAATLDAESEDDVLALTRSLDLRELIEDEMLLALPLVPRHDICPDPLQVPDEIAQVDESQPHPFAALEALKRTRRIVN